MVTENDLEKIEFALYVLQHPEIRGKMEVREWLESGKHRDLLEELRRFREAGELEAAMRSPDVEKQWQYFRGKTKPRVWRMYLKWWLSAAAVVLALVVTDILLNEWYFVDLSLENTVPVARQVRSDVKLITGTGNEFLLGTGHIDTLLKGEGLVVDSLKGRQYLKVLRVTDRVAEQYTLQIPRGVEYLVVLEDGSRVWLNSESEFRYPSVFDQGKREVYLKGEGYFEVVHDKERPFIVRTEKVSTRVLGTEFNVQSYTGKAVNVTLVKGSVAVRGNNDQANTSEVVLNPGENASWEGGRFRVETVDALKYVAWKDGFFYYDNEPLENILNELGRWFDFTVFYQNPEVKSYRFKFWANRKDTPEEIMERLNETGKLHVRFNGESVVVSL